jgi:hypothetical protein
MCQNTSRLSTETPLLKDLISDIKKGEIQKRIKTLCEGVIFTLSTSHGLALYAASIASPSSRVAA